MKKVAAKKRIAKDQLEAKLLEGLNGLVSELTPTAMRALRDEALARL